MRVFVTVGNALVPFDRLLRMVDEALYEVDAEGVCQHGVSAIRPRGLQPVETLSRKAFDDVLLTSDRVVCHAGVGTLWSALRAGHTPIVVPRRRALNEIVNDHQLEICDALSAADQIRVVTSSADLVRELRTGPPRAGARTAEDSPGLEKIANAVAASIQVQAVRRPRLLRVLAAAAPALARLRVPR